MMLWVAKNFLPSPKEAFPDPTLGQILIVSPNFQPELWAFQLTTEDANGLRHGKGTKNIPSLPWKLDEFGQFCMEEHCCLMLLFMEMWWNLAIFDGGT